MREQDFRQALRRQGKKNHVVDGLVGHVAHFESHLKEKRGKALDKATEEDLSTYLAVLDPEEVKLKMRGVAIYYSFIGKGKLAALARDIRQQITATTRRTFKLRDFRGVDLDFILMLEEMGIKSADSILEAGKTAKTRKELSDKTGVPDNVIMELVKLSDLSRLEGVKGIRARLYYDAGVDTVEKLSAWEPDELLVMLKEFVARTGFNGIAPLPKEVRGTINRAKTLPRVVEYE